MLPEMALLLDDESRPERDETEARVYIYMEFFCSYIDIEERERQRVVQREVRR